MRQNQQTSDYSENQSTTNIFQWQNSSVSNKYHLDTAQLRNEIQQAYAGLILESFTYSSNLELPSKALVSSEPPLLNTWPILYCFPCGWKENALKLNQHKATKFTWSFGPSLRAVGVARATCNCQSAHSLWTAQRAQGSLTWHCRDAPSWEYNSCLTVQSHSLPTATTTLCTCWYCRVTYQNVLEIQESHPSSLKSMANSYWFQWGRTGPLMRNKQSPKWFFYK